MSVSPSGGTFSRRYPAACMAANTRIRDAGASRPTALPTFSDLLAELVRMNAMRFSALGLRRSAASRKARPATRATRSGSGRYTAT